MVRSYLSCAIIIILLIRNSITISNDILEYYHPDPNLPEQLNEWLTKVQEHKNDFRLIREAVEDRRKEKEHFRNIPKREFHYLFDESEDDYNEKSKESEMNDMSLSFYGRNNFRSRRDSDVKVKFVGKSGEVQRSDEKYPDRYKGNINKRDLEIDIIKDGKLLKKINDNQNEAKQIILNIKPKTDPNKKPDPRSLNRQDEVNSNFKNLYNANEHLITDNSALRQEPVIYRVTLPDVNSYLKTETESSSTQQPMIKNFNRNGLQDLSPLWSVTEKQYIQKGVDTAQKMTIPKWDNNKDGFEEIKSVILAPKSESKFKIQESKLINEDVKPHKFTFDENKFVVQENNVPNNEQYKFEDKQLQSHNLNELNYKNDDILNVKEETQPQSIVDISFEKPHTEKSFGEIEIRLDGGDPAQKSDNILIDNPAENLMKKPFKRNDNSKVRKRELDASCKIEEISTNPLVVFNPNVDVGQNTGTVEAHQFMENSNENMEYGNTFNTTATNFQLDNGNGMNTATEMNDFMFSTTEIEPTTWNIPFTEETTQSPLFEIETTTCEEQQEEPMVQPNFPNQEMPMASPNGNQREKPNFPNQEMPMAPPSGDQRGIVIEILPMDAMDRGSNDNVEEKQEKPKSGKKTIKSRIEEHRIVTRIETITEINPNEIGQDNEENVQINHRNNVGANCLQTFVGKPMKTKKHKRKFGQNRKEFELRKNHRHKLLKPHKLERKYRKARRIKKTDDLPAFHKPFDSPNRNIVVETIPAFASRRLKEADYIYDPDLGYPDIEEVDKDLAKKSVTISNQKFVHKNSAEGDYADEEEPATVKNKRTTKLEKKSENEFADPVTTPEEVEDYYADYEGAADDNNDTELGGKKVQKKPKPPVTVKNKVKESKPDVKKHDKTKLKNKPKKEPSKTFLENSEFQHWPKFVRDDQENEEILRKRSLNQKINNSNNKHPVFPLGSKSFFVPQQRKPHNRAAPDSPSTEASSASLSLSDIVTDVGTQATVNFDLTMTLGDFNFGSSTRNGENASNATTIDPCLDEPTPQVRVTNICEENDGIFNRTEMMMTTALPIVPDAESFTASYSSSYEKLDDLLDGRLPFSIVDRMFNHIRKTEKFKKRFKQTLKKTKDPALFSHIREASEEQSRKIVNKLSQLIDQLQITTNCAILPPKIRFYLKTITQAKKENVLAKSKSMEEIQPDDNQNREIGKPSFVFESGFAGDNLEEKISILKNLLNKFQSLPDECKPRALPVKEYIENHLGMLDKMVGESDKVPPKPQQPVVKRKEEEPVNHNNDAVTQSDLVQKELDSLGLGKNQKFRPHFDLNALIDKNRHKKSLFDDEENEEEVEENVRGTTKSSISEKFYKLYDAIRRERLKVRREKRMMMQQRYDDDEMRYNF